MRDEYNWAIVNGTFGGILAAGTYGQVAWAYWVSIPIVWYMAVTSSVILSKRHRLEVARHPMFPPVPLLWETMYDVLVVSMLIVGHCFLTLLAYGWYWFMIRVLYYDVRMIRKGWRDDSQKGS